VIADDVMISFHRFSFLTKSQTTNKTLLTIVISVKTIVRAVHSFGSEKVSLFKV